MLFFTVPQKSDGILLLLLAPVTLGSVVALVVAELVIYCAVGLICGGGGGGGGGGGSTDPVVTGDSCTATNYCGMTGTGIVESSGFCTALPPPDTACTNGALPDDALVIDPPITKINDDISLLWDIGTFNHPPNCTLSGPQIGTIILSTQTGSTTVTVLGPHVFTLTCGTAQVQAKVRLISLPFET